MKSLLLATIICIGCSNAVWAYPNDSIANRMQHCKVASVTGPWAMANYPTSIDLYYGELTKSDSWNGFIIFGYPTTNSYYPLDMLKMYPVIITSELTATYAGDTATGTTQKIIFKLQSNEETNDMSIYTLQYTQDSGTYECQGAWPMSPPH